VGLEPTSLIEVYAYAQGRILGERGGHAPHLDGCWPKNWDARPIKSKFYQSQNAPKLAFLTSKIEELHPIPPR